MWGGCVVEMKVYCLLLDALPWNTQVVSKATKPTTSICIVIKYFLGRDFQKLQSRENCSTSITSRTDYSRPLRCSQCEQTGLEQCCVLTFNFGNEYRFTGRLPSDLVPGGVGYLAHNEDRYYQWMQVPIVRANPHRPRRHDERHRLQDTNINLLDLLKGADFDVSGCS